MIIDKDNFLDIFPIIKEKLNNAVFISIDEEMTGIISNERSNKNSKLDDAGIRYKKMTTIANKYSIIQFGLCIFEKDEDDEYIVSPYNFYLFPAATSYTDIVMSPSSIDFLRNHHIDFQTWITKGITFVDDKGQAYLERKYNQTPSPSPIITTTLPNSSNDNAASSSVSAPAAAAVAKVKSPLVLTQQSDKDYMERNINRLNEMIKSSSTSKSASNSTSTSISTATTTESENTIVFKKYVFEQSNAYLRRAVYEYLDVNCPPPFFSISKTADLCICVTLLESSVDKELLDRKLHEENNVKFQQEMGFKLLFNELIKCRKPIIGHNCMFDFMFLMRHFHQAPLEYDLSEFKQSFHSLFPTVFDTKFIATSGVMQGVKYENTVLEELYKFIQTIVPVITLTEKIKNKNGFSFSTDGNNSNNSNNSSRSSSQKYTTKDLRKMLDKKLSILNNNTANPLLSPITTTTPVLSSPLTLVFAEDVPPYAEQEKYHDAGWDAYCTGVIFAAQMKLIGTDVEKMSELAGNKLFMMQSLYHMDLHPAHPNGFLKTDGYVFYLSNFPATTVTEEILAVFTKLGYNSINNNNNNNKGVVELIWVDGTSTFLALSLLSSSSSISSSSITTVTDEDKVNQEQKVLHQIEDHLPFGWKIETLQQYRQKQATAQSQTSSQTSIIQVSSTGSSSGNSNSIVKTNTITDNERMSNNTTGSSSSSTMGSVFLDILATPFVYVADNLLGRKRKLSIESNNISNK